MRPIALLAVATALAILPSQATLVELTGVAQLDARGDHACVVTTPGAVQCWGANDAGQLGGGSAAYRSAAGPVTGLSSGAITVAVNGSHSCAIVTGGGVKCWGANASGQLGDGTTTQSAVPVDVQGLPWPVAALSLGVAYTCALSSTGAVACWGYNGDGQLGDGTITQRLAPTPVWGLSSGVTAISASRTYTCAIAAAGVVKCWGNQILAYPDPVRDVAGLPNGATLLATGGWPGWIFHGNTAHACAVVAGTTKCWGYLIDVTDASGASFSGPSDVAGVAPGALAITTGGGRFNSGPYPEVFTYAQTCAVTAGNGVQCWGMNYCGIVGVATGAGCNSLGTGVSNLPPTDVPGLSSGVASVSAATNFTCALQSAGTVKCWGAGYGPQPTAQMSGMLPQVITFGKAPSLRPGSAGSLSVTGGGSGNPIALTSQTPGTCSIGGTTVTAIAAGTCTIAANQAGDGVYYDAAPEVMLSFMIDPRLANVSTRGQALTGNDAMIAGFVIGGATSKTVAIVVTGPSLSAYGITNPAPDPNLTLVRMSDQATLATNDDWQSASNAAQLQAAGFAPPVATEAAILTTLPPGAYTAIVGGAPGTAVVGVYELDASEAPLVNLSTRGLVGTGNDVMIGGFVVPGNTPQRVAIVATGPSLSSFGITNPLANPMLTLVRSSDQAVLAANDDWQAHPNASQLQLAGFAPSNALESAILVTLPPGAYTAIVQGVSGGTGVAVIGIYAVP